MAMFSTWKTDILANPTKFLQWTSYQSQQSRRMKLQYHMNLQQALKYFSLIWY